MSRPCFWLAPFALLLTLAPMTSADDVHDLFDGKSLDGWVVDGPAKGKAGRVMWSVEDGRIVCLGEGFGFLRYDRRQFSDFTLSVEYRFTPKQGANRRATAASVSGRAGSTPRDREKPAPRTPRLKSSCSTTPASRLRHTGLGHSIGTRARPPTRRGRLPSGTRSRSNAPAPGSRSGSTARRSWKPISPSSRI